MGLARAGQAGCSSSGSEGRGGGGVTSDNNDDSGTDGGSYRLPGLHAQSSFENRDGGDESLPPIGNLSLGKANMAGAQRRAYGYDSVSPTSGTYNKNKAGAAAAAASKRQTMPPPVKYAGNKGSQAGSLPPPVAAVAGHKLAPAGPGPAPDLPPGPAAGTVGPTGYKYNAKPGNAGAKAVGNSKYMSPYSLRQLAVAGSGKE